MYRFTLCEEFCMYWHLSQPVSVRSRVWELVIHEDDNLYGSARPVGMYVIMYVVGVNQQPMSMRGSKGWVIIAP